MHKNQIKGKSAEILFEMLCTQNGWHCCKPIVEFLPYDYVVDLGEGFKKIQVKTVYWDKNRKDYRCDLRKGKSGSKNKTKYISGDFDIVAINFNSIDWVLVPWNKIKDYTEINMSNKNITESIKRSILFEV